jgi:hypothetical protein
VLRSSAQLHVVTKSLVDGHINFLSLELVRDLSSFLSNFVLLYDTFSVRRLYRSRAVLRLAAGGIHATSKVVLKAL